MTFASLKTDLSKMGDDINRHEVFTLASSLAYTTALALAPFMMILLFIASLLGPAIQHKIFEQISIAMGAHAGKTVIDIVQNAHSTPTMSNLSGIGGLLILALSASAIFSQLRVALDKINDTKLPASSSGVMGFIKDRILSFSLVFGFIFLSIVSLMVSTLISAFFSGGDGLFWQTMFFLINFCLFIVLFAMIYRFVPTKGFEWKRCRVMGLVSTIFYLIGKAGISVYLGHAGFESSYGAAGSMVVFLAWVYYTTLTLLVSCEFSNHLFFKSRKWTLGMVSA